MNFPPTFRQYRDPRRWASSIRESPSAQLTHVRDELAGGQLGPRQRCRVTSRSSRPDRLARSQAFASQPLRRSQVVLKDCRTPPKDSRPVRPTNGERVAWPERRPKPRRNQTQCASGTYVASASAQYCPTLERLCGSEFRTPVAIGGTGTSFDQEAGRATVFVTVLPNRFFRGHRYRSKSRSWQESLLHPNLNSRISGGGAWESNPPSNRKLPERPF